jgi:hypothetical protein
MPYLLQILCILIIVAACLFIALRPEWRLLVTAMFVFTIIQAAYLFYITGALLTVINFLIGSMAVGILGYSCYRNRLNNPIENLQKGTVFRLLSEFFFILSGFALSYKAITWLTQIAFTQISMGLILIFSAIFLLNTLTKPWQVVVCLIIFLIGFETIYFGFEQSLLVTILLGGVKLAISFTGSYLISFQRRGKPV